MEEIEQGGRAILNVRTREAGRLIGRDGHTLEDLQYLLNRILNRHDETAPNIIVDVEGYRQKESQDFLAASVSWRTRFAAPVALWSWPQ